MANTVLKRVLGEVLPAPVPQGQKLSLREEAEEVQLGRRIIRNVELAMLRQHDELQFPKLMADIHAAASELIKMHEQM